MNRTPSGVPDIAGELFLAGDLHVDVGQQRVTRAGVEIPLPNLTFQLLLALIRAAPNVLSNDLLMARVWPGLIVSPETVSKRVNLLREALGDKRGIARYGFLLAMDEAEAEVALDLSGRPYFVWEGHFNRERVGELPTELVPHFFRSLAETLGAALHIRVRGDNSHHMIESCFKGVGRSLRQAVRLEGGGLPSTKGTL